jgi:hypothetical protein
VTLQRGRAPSRGSIAAQCGNLTISRLGQVDGVPRRDRLSLANIRESGARHANALNRVKALRYYFWAAVEATGFLP